MIETILLLSVLSSPWGAGPAPSAHAVETGFELAASGDGLFGGYTEGYGASVEASYVPHERVYISLALEGGSAWSLCPDCATTAVSGTVRGTAIRTDAFHLTPWVVTTSTVQGAVDLIPGISLEGGTERFRFDLAAPLWSTYDMITTLRAVPEAGISYNWNADHSTRIGVVGVEPTIVAAHRWQVERTVNVEVSARYGEDGTLGAVTLGWRPGQ